MEFSKLYIDDSGFLMCGEPGKSSSIIAGLLFLPLNTSDGKNFDYEIRFINDVRGLCNGYFDRFCNTKYRMF